MPGAQVVGSARCKTTKTLHKGMWRSKQWLYLVGALTFIVGIGSGHFPPFTQLSVVNILDKVGCEPKVPKAGEQETDSGGPYSGEMGCSRQGI